MKLLDVALKKHADSQVPSFTLRGDNIARSLGRLLPLLYAYT